MLILLYPLVYPINYLEYLLMSEGQFGLCRLPSPIYTRLHNQNVSDTMNYDRRNSQVVLDPIIIFVW